MSYDADSTSLSAAIPEITPEQHRRISLYVAGRAHGTQDCAELLRMLGLLAPEHNWVQSGHCAGRGVQGRRLEAVPAEEAATSRRQQSSHPLNRRAA